MDSRELTLYMPNYQCKTPDFRVLGVPFWPFLALWAVRYPGFLGWSKWGLFGVLLAIWLGAKKGSQRGPKTGPKVDKGLSSQNAVLEVPVERLVTIIETSGGPLHIVFADPPRSSRFL